MRVMGEATMNGALGKDGRVTVTPSARLRAESDGPERAARQIVREVSYAGDEVRSTSRCAALDLAALRR